MKPLPPAQIIAEYRAAYQTVHGRIDPSRFALRYDRGWFLLVTSFDAPPVRYRGAQIVHMTGQLRGLVRSRKADHVEKD